MKSPKKGMPNFTNISDEKLEEYLELSQSFIFVYQSFDKEKEELMKIIWNDCKEEKCNRRNEKIEKENKKDLKELHNSKPSIIKSEKTKEIKQEKLVTKGRPKKEIPNKKEKGGLF